MILKINLIDMKTILFLMIFLTLPLHSQWQPNYRLTNFLGNSYCSQQGQRNIVANGQMLHVVWYDIFLGSYQIYYTRSTDGGTTWGSDTNLILTNYESTNPSICFSGSMLHTVWVDRRNGNDEIYYKRSTNEGLNWLPEVRMTDNVFGQEHTTICASGQNVCMFWRDGRNSGSYEIYYRRSTDDGATWTEETRLTNFAGTRTAPAVTVVGSTIHLVWDDGRHGANTEIYYKKSTDYGVTWGNDTRLTNAPEISFNSSVAVSGNIVHVTWQDYRHGLGEIYYKNSTDGGTTWGADVRITNDPLNSGDPSIDVSGPIVHLVWEDKKDGVFKIYYNVSTNAGATWGTEVKLSAGSGECGNPSIIVSGSTVNTVWHDYSDGNFEIYYDKNPSGNAIGIHNISSNVPADYLLSQNYPNPFNPVTNIEFSIAKRSFVKLAVCDMTGREIEIIASKELNAGKYGADWDASKYSSGIYFYTIVSEGFTQTKKMMLIK